MTRLNFVLLVICFSLNGCGGGGSSSSTPSSGSSPLVIKNIPTEISIVE